MRAPSLFRTAAVTVTRPVRVGTDRLGSPVTEPEAEEVGGVLPQPGATSDLDASRPEGARADMTFHFPKGYGRPLKGCTVSYGGRDYRVVGDPQPYVEGNVPGAFSLAVETERVDG